MKSKLLAAVALAILPFCSVAHAQIQGVNVQVSGGKRMPTVEQLRMVLRPGDFVRDVLAWHRVDKTCDLRNNPGALIQIPGPLATLYTNVAAAVGRNFVVLGFANKACGQATNSGARDFPDDPVLIAEFAAYAAAVARQVPALGGISIWNEINGTWRGGYSTREQKLTNYCRLSNAVISRVRQINPALPIAIGATVGSGIGPWFKEMFNTYGCIGKNDPNIWLDVHPYLSGKYDNTQHKPDWEIWNDSIAQIRADGITNPLAGTEWGAKAYFNWQKANPGGDYVKTFQGQVTAQEKNWAAFSWYEMLFDKAAPNAGLFDVYGQLKPAGQQYIDYLRR